MPTVTFTVRMAKIPNFEAVIQEVMRVHRTQVVKDIDGYFNRVTGNWSADNRPKLKHTLSRIQGTVTTTVYPQGKIYKYVTAGTRKNYPIPKPSNTKAKILRFRRGYVPKTRPGGQYGGPGQAMGEWVHRKRVIHPGIKARRFEYEISKDYQPKFEKLMQEAVKRGIQAAMRTAK